jgi:hypothetical protein
MKTIAIEAETLARADTIPDDLITRIRKLRWMGMEEEARLLERRLKSAAWSGNDSVLAEPHNTD